MSTQTLRVGVLGEEAARVESLADSASASARLSLEPYRLLVESATDYAIIMLDTRGRVMTWNVGAERIEGYHAEEVIGRHFRCFYPAEAAERGDPDRALELAERTGRFAEESWRVRRDGGRYRAHVTIMAIRDAERGLMGFAEVVHDMTERIEAEAKLRRNEMLLNEAQQIAKLGSGCLDLRTQRAEASEEMRRIFGRTPSDELSYSQFIESVHPDDRELLLCVIEAALGDLQPRSFEFRIVRADGQVRHIYAAGKIVQDQSGHPIEMRGIAHDITEQKAAEEEIRRLNADLERRVAERTEELAHANAALRTQIEERERKSAELRRRGNELAELQMQLQAILRTTPHGLCMLSPAWTVVWANDAMGRLSDSPVDDPRALVGRPFSDFFPAERQFEEYRDEALRSIRMTGSSRREERLARAAGALWVDISIVRLDPRQTASGYVVSVADITERKRNEEIVIESQRFLQSALDSLSEQIAILDGTGAILAVNEAWRRRAASSNFLGSCCAIGQNFLDACRGESAVNLPNGGNSIAVPIQDVIADGRPDFEAEYLFTEGNRRRWFSLRAQRLESPEGVRVVLTHEEISQRKLAEEQLRHFARHDPLTGLANRTLFYKSVESALARIRWNKGALIAALFVDLEGLQGINDAHGRMAGDQLLVLAAGRIAGCLRQSDVAARLAGVEFGVLLDGVTGPEEGSAIAERVLAELSRPFEIEGRAFEISACVGFATSAPALVRGEDLMRQAEEQLRRSKRRMGGMPS